MKIFNKVVFILIAIVVVTSTYSQGGVSINSSGVNPDGSAMLDIQSTEKGLLIPRLQLTDINDMVTITAAANSLLVFNLAPSGIAPNDVVEGFYYWDASIAQWVKLVSGAVVGTDDQQIDSLVLVGNTLTAYVEDGGSASVDLSALSDADSDPTNEHNTGANLTGTDLNIVDGGGTQTVDLSALLDSSYSHDEWKDSDTLGGGFTTNFVYANQAKSFGNDVVVTDSGRVGVGTNNPTRTLHVNSGSGGNAAGVGMLIEGNSNGSDILTVINNTTPVINNTTYSHLRFQESGNTAFDIGYNHNSKQLRFENRGTVNTITNGPTHMVIDSVGRLGIGLVNPSELLELDSGGIQLNDNYGIGFRGEIPNDAPTFRDAARIYFDTSFFGGAEDALVFEKTDAGTVNPDGGFAFVNKGSTNVRRIDMVVRGNGNVGIGTSTPIAQLDLEESVDPHLRIYNPVLGASAYYVESYDMNGNGDQDLNFRQGANHIATIDDLGRFGIGTTSPVDKLHVQDGNVRNVNDGFSIHSAYSYSNGVSTSGHFIGYKAGGTELAPTHPLAGVSMASFQGRNTLVPNSALANMSVFSSENHTNTALGSELRFRTVDNGTTGATDRMIITENGNVGIGTVTPRAELHVIGSGTFGSNGARATIGAYQPAIPYQGLENSALLGAGQSNFGGYVEGSPNGNLVLAIQDNQAADAVVFANGGGNYITDSTYDNVTMVVRADGNVGIGTTTPAARLHIDNNPVNQRAFEINTTNTSSVMYEDTDFIGFLNVRTIAGNGFVFSTTPDANDLVVSNVSGAGRVGVGVTNPTEKLHVGGNILASGTITPSDERYKENIVTLDSSLAKVLQLRGVNYDMKEAFKEKGFGDSTQIGVIAQEVEKIYPELIITHSDGFKGVDYSKFTPILIEAIKEQQLIIEKLKSNNSDKKDEMIELKAEVFNQNNSIVGLQAQIDELKLILLQTSKK